MSDRIRISAASPIPLFPVRIRAEDQRRSKMEPEATVPNDADKRGALVNSIARLLGVDPTDPDAIRGALETLLSTQEQELARKRLSSRELEKCKARGVDPKRYAATKVAMARGAR